MQGRDDGPMYGSRRRLATAAAASAGRPRARSRPIDPTLVGDPNMYKPGDPIGFFRAKGTVYQKKYITKKMVCACLFLGPPTLIISLVIMLLPVIGAVAEHALHTAIFNIQSSNITEPGNSSFPLALGALVTQTGLFPAQLYFRQPINVYWNTPLPDMREVHLGHFDMGMVKASGGKANVNQITTFHIDDEEAFGIFARYLITEPVFTWRINCTQVHAVAFSFLPVYKYLPIQKDIVIKGMNNLEDLHLINVQLPGNDPKGGIQVSATATVTNPSPFGMSVGTLVLDLFYEGLYLGPVQAEGVNLTAGKNILTLDGRILPYANNETALAQLGVLFTNYINSVPTIVIGKGVSATMKDGSVVSWLAEGISALSTSIPFMPPAPINPITGIIINYMSLAYDEQRPYNPMLFSNNLDGKLALPFGFSMNITQLATEITLVYNGADVGTATGIFAPARTNISSLSIGGLIGDVYLELPPTQLILPNTTLAAKEQLIQFQDSFVFKSSAAFEARGAARAITDTPVGKLLLDGIKFDVVTGLIGLNGLLTYPTIINSVDLLGGTKDATILKVGLTMINPSNLNLSIGDTTFDLSYQGVKLGNATLLNLNLKPGRNDYNSSAFFDPNRAAVGLETLNRFIGGMDTTLDIVGSATSSKIESLAFSLAGIKLNSTLPGLAKQLVKSANLTVLPTTGVDNNLANSVVYLANPFTSDLTITSISAKASSHGIFLANINSSTHFVAAGGKTSASPTIPLSINLYPPDLMGLLRALAIDSGQNPAYLDGLVSIAGYTLTPTTRADGKKARKRDLSFSDREDNVLAHKLMGWGDMTVWSEESDEDQDDESDGVAKRAQGLSYHPLHKRKNFYSGFDLPAYVLKCFANAKADLVITSNAVIGEYSTTLSFSQNDVPLGTDKTLLLLLPSIASPIVQKIVDSAILNIDRVTITEVKPNSFVASMQAALTNAGPFDGMVQFPQGLDIYWEGKLLTSTAFPSVNLVGDIGSSIDAKLQGTIPDVDYFTNFTEMLLMKPSFIWTVKGKGLSVSALGIVVHNVTISKDVQIKGMNGLAGNVIINSFDVPSNDPAGGLHLTAVSTIMNPAQVGISLSRFGTNLRDGDIILGPAAASKPVMLNALAVNHIDLVGRMVRQTTPVGLASLSNIFTRFVQGLNTNVTVQGDFAGPADVLWLNKGIKALSILVILPAQRFDVLRTISLNSMALYFTIPSAWSPRTDSSNTTANFFLPFKMPINITQVSGPFTLNYNKQDMGILNIPPSPATTQVERRIMLMMFKNVPLAVIDSAHDIFSDFVADFTKMIQVTINLHGKATALTDTASGKLTISDIPFNLNSSLLGLQNLNAKPANISNLDVAHGYPTYLVITVNTTLYNPSDTTVGAGDVTFSVIFQNHVLGTALIHNTVLLPGENTLPTEIRYMPVGADNILAGQVLLQNYVSNITSDAMVKGNDKTTQIPSLLKGLSGITLSTKIPSLGKMIVIGTTLVVPKNIGQTGIASAQVTIANPFTATINILKIHADAIVAGVTVGTIDQDLAATKNIVVSPGKKVSQSQPIPININIDPKNLIKFIEAAAKEYSVSLGPLPPFFQEVLNMGSTNTTISPFPDVAVPPCHSGKAFDTLGAVTQLLAHMTATIPINSTMKLDDFQSSLNFVQTPVPVKTDSSALYLVGPAAAPLIQLVVNQSQLTVSQANATSLTDEGFTVSLLGSLKVNTPADAYIEFPDGININFQGKDIAVLLLKPLCTAAPDGIPVLAQTSPLKITDQAGFVDFTYFLLTEPSFEWFLHTKTARARALGIVFSNVVLEKTIKMDGLNGIPGLVITDFSTPGDAPGRINIKASTPIISSSSLGVELDYASFDMFFQGSPVGTITSELSFLAPKATTVTNFNGYLKSQEGNTKGLADVGIMFSQLLAGKNSTLSIRGVNVVTRANKMQPVSWLTAAFVKFTDTVVLPGHLYQVLYSITLSDLIVTVANITDPYTILTSNKQTLATFSNPFNFHMHPLAVSPQIILSYLGANTAQLNLPMTPVTAGISTGPKDIQPIEFGFENQYFVGLDHASFEAFFAKLADTTGANFGLKGTTSVVAGTPIGNPVITGIPFNVSTYFGGLNSFGHKGVLSDVQVNNPTSNYIGINLMVMLDNASNLTLFTKQVSLPGFYPARNVYVGRAVIPELNLAPGPNLVHTEFQLSIPDNSSAVQEVLSLYLQPKDNVTSGLFNTVGLEIHGVNDANPPLTPYACLEEAMAGVTMSTSLQGVGTRMVARVRVYIPLDIVVQEMKALIGQAPNGSDIFAYSYIDAINVMPSEIHFVQLSTTVYNSKDPSAGQYSRFTANFNDTNPFVLPAAITTNQPSVNSTASPEIRNVLLSQGLLASLPLLGHNVNTDNYVQINVKGPNGTYFIPGLHYVENDVNTTYFLSINGTGDSGININGVSSLTDLLDKAIGGGAAKLLINGLGAIDPSNPVSVFHGFGLLPNGDDITKLLCNSGGLGQMFGGAACKPASSTSTTISTSTSSSSSLQPSSTSTSIAPAANPLASLFGASPKNTTSAAAVHPVSAP